MVRKNRHGGFLALHRERYLHLDEAGFAPKLEVGAIGVALLAAAFVARNHFDSLLAARLCAMAAAIWLGVPLISIALTAQRKRHLSMHDLMILAILAAFGSGHYVEAGLIALLSLAGVLLHNRLARRARVGLSESAIALPDRALRIKNDQEQTTESVDLGVGDVVRVAAGQRIPADGRVVRGFATLNEKAVNGSNASIDKATGDEVFAGSLNTHGSIDVQLTATGQHTWVSQRAVQINHTYSTQSWITWWLRRYGPWYTPAVLMLAALVMLATNFMEQRWERAIGMLLVACPAALALAIGAAVAAATSTASRMGLLLRRGIDLDRARRISAVLLDETEGLAVGQYEVVHLAPFDNLLPNDLLQIAVTATQYDGHPLADAVRSKARQYQVYPDDAAADAGAHHPYDGGFRAVCDGKLYQLGPADWLLRKAGETMRPHVRAVLKSAQQTLGDHPDAVVLYVWRGSKCKGWIGLTERPRVGAASAITRLRELGVKQVELLTRLPQPMAQKLAQALGCEVRTLDSAAAVRQRVNELRRQGLRVAVLRDVQDHTQNPTVGDLTMELNATRGEPPRHARCIRVYSSNPGRLPFLVFLSQQMHRTVKQLIFTAAAVMLLLLIATGGGWLDPVVAAGVQALWGGALVVMGLRPLRLQRVAEARERQVRLRELKGQYLQEKAR